MHNVAVWANSNKAAKDAREVEWAAPCYLCERGHLDRLANVGDDVLPYSPQDLVAQHTAYGKLRARRMTRHQTVYEKLRPTRSRTRAHWGSHSCTLRRACLR